MSELTRCNYCNYQQDLAEAKKKGWKVTLFPDDFGLGGVRVYIHPKHILIAALGKKARAWYDTGTWYMALGGSCCC